MTGIESLSAADPLGSKDTGVRKFISDLRKEMGRKFEWALEPPNMQQADALEMFSRKLKLDAASKEKRLQKAQAEFLVEFKDILKLRDAKIRADTIKELKKDK